MIRMFVRHNVSDFIKWKKAYDEFETERNQMGVLGDAVFKSAVEPNDVTVWHDFNNLDAALAFKESKRLREVMSNAGVTGAPSIWFTSQT